jgi:hypothetical protein
MKALHPEILVDDGERAESTTSALSPASLRQRVEANTTGMILMAVLRLIVLPLSQVPSGGFDDGNIILSLN